MPLLSLLLLISRNSPQQLVLVSPELPRRSCISHVILVALLIDVATDVVVEDIAGVDQQRADIVDAGASGG